MWNWCVFAKSLCFCMLCHSGIGRATSLALAHCGAKVVAVTRSQADLSSLLQEVTPRPAIAIHSPCAVTASVVFNVDLSYAPMED